VGLPLVGAQIVGALEAGPVSVQLGFDFAAPASERRYGCCGKPTWELSEPRTTPRPHADDCPNPNVGTWVDRATGWPIRRLKCVDDSQPCPYGGTFPAKPGLADPHGGACCKAFAKAKP
jgi:hypothetical protein